MNTIREEWESYQQNVVPKEADLIQVTETRMAFYAGAFAMFTLLDSAAKKLTPVDASITLDTLKAECLKFCADETARRSE